MSDYLYSWAEKQGFPVVQDEWNNLIIDVPATEGMEDKPLVALQGHMDMVFAQKDGLDLDPYTTAIQTKSDGKWLTSDGRTSLGADDGIGVAIIECVAEEEMAHGPLRILFTTDEENGCTGANNIDPQCVSDVKYMINLDDEAEGEIVISSASGVRFEHSCSLSPAASTGNMGVGLLLSGLTGGHSGAEIDKGRLNGILGHLGEQFNGVYSMSGVVDGLVESSSNLGMIALEPTGFSAKGMLRSSDMGKQEELRETNRKLAEKLRFELTENDSTAPWSAKEDNRLQKIAEEAYRELFSAELDVIALHVGLECGVFSQYNPEMDIITMGPTITAAHSVQEALEIETCGKVWRFLESVLNRV